LIFEKRAVYENLYNDKTLLDYIQQKINESPNEKWYVFLDEIQTVENWDLACKSLRLENISLFITGSNSKLLSREFTKELSGRYVSFLIKPFVYKEIAEYAKELNKKITINNYLIYGGFPKRIEFNDEEAMIQYLNDLDQTIVINDIINRYKIRKDNIFKKVANFVLISNSRIFSGNSIFNYLKSQKIECSINTVMKFLDYLEEAYVIRKIPQYSTKAKKQLDFYTKLYNEDVAFNTIRQINNRFDITHNLENVVYNELIYMGYSLTVFNINGKEIDFLAAKNGKEYFVQVAYSIAENSTYEREFAPLNMTDNSRKKIIITNDEIDYSTSTVQHIKLEDFLFMEDLES